MPSSCNNDGYDANGNLLHKTDARGETVNYTYDALNRMTSKTSADTSVNNQYYYDIISAGNLWGTPFDCTNGIGRLCLADHGGVGGTAFNYDVMGRPTSSVFAVLVGDPTYRTGYQAKYDLAGNVTELTYPSGLQISQGYDGAGRVNCVHRGALQSPCVPDLAKIEFAPNGTPSKIEYGNQAKEVTQLNKRLQPCESYAMLPATAGGTAIFDRQYSYGAATPSTRSIGDPCPDDTGNNGNIWHIMDATNTSGASSSAARNQHFQYDSLNRLTHWQTASMSGQAREMSYGYDSFGNLTQNSGPTAIAASTMYEANNRYKASQFPCLGLMHEVGGYDDAGNVLCQVLPSLDHQAFVYDAESQVIEAWRQQANNTYKFGYHTAYDYNGLGERELKRDFVPVTNAQNQVEQQLQSWREYTYFNGQPYSEKDNTGAWTDYIYAAGRKIARIEQQKPLLHLKMNFAANGHGTLLALGATNVSGQPIVSGDRLAFSVKAAGGVTWGTGFWQTTPSGQLIGSDTLDQTGQSMSLLNISDGQWRHESGDLSNNAGNSLHTMLVAFQPATQSGPVEVWLKDLVITHADGSITPILTANQVSLTPVEEPTSHPALSATPQTVAAGTNLTLDYNPGPVDPAASTTYYLADQVGTTQMELSAGGWPIWKGDFAPFGQELDNQTTNNHYKFTGKERDTESGLDYFGARYYVSSMGRMMSPDPGWLQQFDPSDPQTLNQYSYGLNNPLRNTDPTGMTCQTNSSDGTVYDNSDGNGCKVVDEADAKMAPSAEVYADGHQDLVQTSQDNQTNTWVTQWLQTQAPQYSAQVSAQGQQLLKYLAKDTAGVPTVCSAKVWGQLGTGAGAVGYGYDVGSNSGKAYGSVRPMPSNIGDQLSPVSVSVRTDTAMGVSTGFTVRDPETGVGLGASVNDKGRASLTLSERQGPVTVGMSAALGTMGDPACQPH